jgi:uncharacterized protein YcbK (DUF882 family)
MRWSALVLLASFAFASSATAEKKKKRTAVFSGANAPRESFRKEPLPRPSGNIWLRAENLGEEVRVNIYKPDGSFDNASLAKLDELFRCLSTGEVRAMSAELYEHLSRIQDHFDGKQIQFYSGFRITDQSTSRHYHASAADFKIKGVSIYEIKKYAETLDTGHMGIGVYPNTQFVHVDIRAPGEPSFRWTDYSGGKSGKGKSKPSKKTGRTQPARKPVS